MRTHGPRWTGDGRRASAITTPAPLYGLGLSETRLNPFLRGKPRGDYVISTKVGRLLRVATPETRDAPDKWIDVPSRNEVFDFSYDGVLRSLDSVWSVWGWTGWISFMPMTWTCSAKARQCGWRRCRRPSWRVDIAPFCGCGRKA